MAGVTNRRRSRLLPMLAFVAALVLLARGLSVERASADGFPSPDFSIEIDVDGDTTPDCDTRGSPPEDSCVVDPNAAFTVELYLNVVTGMPDHDGDGEHGYTGFRASLAHPETLPVQDRPGDAESRDETGQPFWPDLGQFGCTEFDGVDGIADTLAYVGDCEIPFGGVESFYTGKLMEIDFACSPGTVDAVTLVNQPLAATSLADDVNKQGFGGDANNKGAPEILTIKCGFPWDVNGDGAVSIGDVFAVVMAFGQAVPPAPQETDVNGDSMISGGDIAAVVQHFGQTAP